MMWYSLKHLSVAFLMSTNNISFFFFFFLRNNKNVSHFWLEKQQHLIWSHVFIILILYSLKRSMSPYFEKDIISIENVQSHAMRLVKSVSHLGYADRLKTLGLPMLEYRREPSKMIDVYKIVNNIDKVDKSKFFTMATNTTRGHSKKLFKK